MRSEKRTWIYSGLAIPSGVGVVRRKTTAPTVKQQRVLLIGNEISKTLITFFSQFALLDNIYFRAEIRKGNATEWIDGALHESVVANQPTIVVFSFGTPEDEDTKKLAMIVRDLGARPIAVVHPKDDKDGKTRTVRFLATLASKIWSNHVKV